MATPMMNSQPVVAVGGQNGGKGMNVPGGEDMVSAGPNSTSLGSMGQEKGGKGKGKGGPRKCAFCYLKGLDANHDWVDCEVKKAIFRELYTGQK